MEGGDDLPSTLENHLRHLLYTPRFIKLLNPGKKMDTLSVSDSPDGFVSHLPYIPY